MRPTKLGAMRQLLRRFKSERKGSTAIEFAFVIVPFLTITLGTLEIALIHLSRSSMTDAVDRTSRQIMTGQGGCVSADQYIEQLCDRLSFSNGNCTENVKIIVEELDSFTDNPSAAEDNFEAITSSIENGRENSIMLLRSFQRWNVIIPLLDQALGGENGELIIVSNHAFRNEPFGANDGCLPTS